MRAFKSLFFVDYYIYNKTIVNSYAESFLDQRKLYKKKKNV